ncbi:hypothetical protein ASD89_01955 [Caulobacter sp. Root656]|jgi:uncharacterized membrane protein|uniref:DUF2177 family protein n=1 Tax=Caulobacter TaxID=75 RepID=UPI0006F406AF|nr:MULTISPECIES: DUF2177 family protein [Caulobacter]KQZ28341.1 hypothetical protein ASD47_22180 [Caulobacter sp. Root1472]KRA67013.1 hypothetical protein ASD89_01955 [Caulobacter sp. Root656]GGL10102.1 membrane protein [Caulobacter rhizosphaerae]
MPYLVAYVASMIVFLGLDAVWLSLMGPRLYRPVLGDMLAQKFNAPAAIAFYVIYGLGVVALAVAPALRENAGGKAALSGAVLGFVAYATYDLTNQATLRVWSTRLTLADMAWGAALTALAAYAGFQAARLVAR